MTPQSRQTQLAQVHRRGAPDAELALHSGNGWGGPAAPAAESGDSLWKLVDDRMRGRWVLMIVLALGLGVGLALLGWRSTVPKYESVGVIRVISKAPVVLAETIEHNYSDYARFLNTQIQLIKSRRVIENAMKDEELARLEWAQQAGALSELEDRLDVQGDRFTELIYVQYESEEPLVAQSVVNAVIRSYDEIYGQAGGKNINETLEKLRQYEQNHRRDLHRVRADIRAIQERHGMDPEELQSMNRQKLEQLEEQIFAAERAMKNVEVATSSASFATEDAAAPPQVLNRLEQIDPELAARRIERDRAFAEFERVRQRYRPGSGAYEQTLHRAEVADGLFETQYRSALANWEQMRLQLIPGATILAGDYEGWPPEALRDEVQALKSKQLEIRRDNQALLADVQLLRDKQQEEDIVRSKLEQTTTRIDGLLREEHNLAERINVEQEGFRPLEPSSDGRARRAAVGLVLGCGLSFSLFFLLGTIDRRAFGADQLTQGASLPMLGVLPDLGRGVLDPEASDVAAHCVHQIRNQIEALRARTEGFVLVVSSPFQGDGKTSIVISLGWSYAVAGHKVLLIDCDLVGRSLTRQVGMTGREGLREAIMSGAAVGRTIASPVENLDVLPVGADTRFGAESIRRDGLDRLFEELRPRYDVIIVDTGPLLGSLESVPASAAADAVVLSVRRGRSRTRLEECLTRLHAVGASCLGIILNCATRADCYRSVSEASLAATHEAGERGVDEEHSIIRGGGAEKNPLVSAMEQTQREPATAARP